MAIKPQIHRKYKYFPKGSDKKTIGKYEIQAGQIILIRYNSQIKKLKDRLPLVFVVDTDRYGSGTKAIHGLNLNYIPDGEAEKMFLHFLTKTGWDKHRKSTFPRVNIWDEKDTIAARTESIYNTIIKPLILPRYSCWRTYKYSSMSSVEVVRYNFNAKPLVEAVSKTDGKTISNKKMSYYSKRTIHNKFSSFYRGKDYQKLLEQWKKMGLKFTEEEAKQYEVLFNENKL
jgi:hypothetical protein|tara:strand:+ start:1024 stop:1710 length:687 start_codon:yes stop_codon:yes gene_type:complete